MKRIAIIHTGGTISMLENKQTGSIYTTEQHPLSAFNENYRHYANVDELVEFSLPSPQITPNHMLKLSKRITHIIDDYDGIVVTHGTDTLEETAYFLDLVLATAKPVIMTGAMRSSNEIGSDALYNLISSIRVAVNDQAINKGVLVVMNDEIHSARYATKTSTSNIATFQSPQYGPIGIITKETVLFHHALIARSTYQVENLTKNVFLLKAYAGMDHEIIEAIHQLKPDGLVIEALGQGNLPEATLKPLQRILNEHIPIVMVSRCYQGVVQPTYAYTGGGKQLKEMGIIFSNGLTGPKARLKLMIALENSQNIIDLKHSFEII